MARLAAPSPKPGARRTLVLIFLLLIVCGLSIGFRGPISALLAAATSSFGGAQTVVFFTPYGGNTLQTGDVVDVDLNINAKVPIDAIGATVTFPIDTLQIVGISKRKSFLDLWTEDTVIKEETGEVHFSGGTTMAGGLMGTGTVLTLSVRAKAPGIARLAVDDIQIFARDGKGTELESYPHSLTYSIHQPPAVGSGNSATPSHTAVSERPILPSPDLNGDGGVDLVDVSILTVHMLMPYDARYDLDADGSIGLSDLSVLIAKMRSR